MVSTSIADVKLEDYTRRTPLLNARTTEKKELKDLQLLAALTDFLELGVGKLFEKRYSPHFFTN